jgi:uncharacterized protein (TIGR02996 family)
VDTQQTVLHALHTDPWDTTAWSALADCLEESGQAERAELLRLSRLPLPAGTDRLAAEGRVRELLADGVRPCVPTLSNGIGMGCTAPTTRAFAGRDYRMMRIRSTGQHPR